MFLLESEPSILVSSPRCLAKLKHTVVVYPGFSKLFHGKIIASLCTEDLKFLVFLQAVLDASKREHRRLPLFLSNVSWHLSGKEKQQEDVKGVTRAFWVQTKSWQNLVKN